MCSPSLNGGEYVSLTLAWDRTVEFFEVDGGTAGESDIGDDFLDNCCFTNLDLYLMPAGATDLAQAITSSQAEDGNDTLGYIFFEIPSTDSYEIWVHQFASQFGLAQDYALAWWAGAATTLPLTGDYDGSGLVDANDYNTWKGNFGSAFTGADGNGNGIVGAADYSVWRDHLGQMVGSGGIAAVPESERLMLLTVVSVLTICRRPIRWKI